MRTEIIQYLDQHSDLKLFVRRHPEWYRELSRHPEKVSEIKEKADDYFGRTLSKRIEKVGEKLSMIHLLMDLAMLAGESNDEETEADQS